MKKSLTIIIFLVSLQFSAFAQTKIDEFSKINGHDMTGRLDTLFITLDNRPQSKALIIIYTGNDYSRFGNVNELILGIKGYSDLGIRGKFVDRIKFVVAKGKTLFAQEYWLIEKGDKLPKFEKANPNFNNLKEKFLFAESCNACDDEYSKMSGSFIDWNLLAKILKENPNYIVLMTLGKKSRYYDFEKEKTTSAKKFAKKLRGDFVEKHKIDKKRFRYKVLDREEWGEEIYIIPKKK